MTRAMLMLAALGAIPALASVATAEEMLGVRGDGAIVTFDSAHPDAVVLGPPLIGLAQNEYLVGVCYRPTDGALFGVGSTSRLYRIATDTGFAVAVGASRFSPILDGVDFGVTVDPGGATLHVVSDTGQNLVLDASTGVSSSIGARFVYAVGDVHANATAGIVACAWRTTTQAGSLLYGVDLARGLLVRIDSPAAGVIRTVGSLGVAGPIAGLSGLTISTDTGVAYAAFDLQSEAVSRFYAVNLTTGAATQIGTSGAQLRDATVVPSSPAAPAGTRLVALVGATDLLTITTDAPQTVQRTVHVKGLALGDSLLGVATRPATGILYGLTRSALYNLHNIDGTAERVRDGFVEPLPDLALACDFDPSTGRLRVAGGSSVNLIVDADTGLVIDRDTAAAGLQTDAPFTYAAGDPFGTGPAAVGALAFVGRTTPFVLSKAYVLETDVALLARLGGAVRAPDEARDGLLYGVGPLAIDGVTSLPAALAMTATSDRAAYAAVQTTPTSSSLYHVNLVTGAASFVEDIGGTSTGAVHGLTYEPTVNPPRLKITKLSAKLNFKKPGRDTITLRGVAQFPVGTLIGKTVTVDVDGLASTFTLNAKGKQKIAGDSIQLGGQAVGGVALILSLTKESLVPMLVDEAMDGTVFAHRSPRQVAVALTIDGRTYRTIVTVAYSAKPGKSGSATTN